MNKTKIINQTKVLCMKAYKAVKRTFSDSFFDKEFAISSIPDILNNINYASVLICEAKTKYMVFNDSFEDIEIELEAYFDAYDKFNNYIFNELAVTKNREHICDTLGELDESYQVLEKSLQAISPDPNIG